MSKLLFVSTRKEFEKVRLYKDEGLLPYYLGKKYKFDVDFLCRNKKKWMPSSFRGVNIIEKKTFFNSENKFFKNLYLDYMFFLIKNSKKYKKLVFFQLHPSKVPLVLIYKFLNPEGKIYMKLDIMLSSIDFFNSSKGLKKFFYKYLLNKIDLFSCETEVCCDSVKKNGILGVELANKITYLKNGFDEDYLIKNDIKINKFEEKENIMITVGRIGTEQKNNEMLIEALKRIDLKNWKVLLIGPYTKEFKKLYDEFSEKNKEKIVLIENIDDKKVLYEYYNKAKVFILTSKWESFGLVLGEALRFGNYIITTDVGAAKEITKNGKIGKIIKNTEQLEDSILKVIEEKIDLKKKYLESIELAMNEFDWNKIVKNKDIYKFFIEEEINE